MGLFVPVDASEYENTLVAGKVIRYLKQVNEKTGLHWVIRQQEENGVQLFEIYCKVAEDKPWQIIYFPTDEKKGCPEKEVIIFLFGILSGVAAADAKHKKMST